jgi:two-component system sensor histidine kinase RpfC
MTQEFDLALLRELAEASSRGDFVESFARASLRDAMLAVERLEDAGRRADWNEFRDRAHAIKGVTANVGATRAAGTADTAMRRASEQLPASWRDDCRRLRDAIAAAQGQLDAALAALRGQGHDPHG